MPGLIGFTDQGRRYENGMLLNMRSLLKYGDTYTDDELYTDGTVYASRTHLGILSHEAQPARGGMDVLCWLEGEFYNQEELNKKYNVDFPSESAFFANVYAANRSFDFLRDIDGYYCAVLYDKKKKRVHLVSDRYGFKPLHWAVIDEDLVWSSEVKGFLEHRGFAAKIDRVSVSEFFGMGYLLENRTWFEGIELVPPSAVLVFDIEDRDVHVERYWSWNEIRLSEKVIDEREAVAELSGLFQDSVRKRTGGDKKIAVSLSGGLDSRAIVAAMPGRSVPLHTFTFGLKESDDTEIAMEVANKKGAIHHFFELRPDNWLLPRLATVWISDGAMNLMDMHGTEFCDSYGSFCHVVLNGYAGDLILGGSYLRSWSLDKKISTRIVKDVTGAGIDVGNFDDWYMINKTDPYFINNRVRRFTNCGLIVLGKWVEVRIPFWDNKLVEFVYGLPDSLRFRGYLYKRMLLGTFPDYYKRIPWQKTGLRIGFPEPLVNLLSIKNRILKKARTELERFGYRYRDLKYYTDYRHWMMEPPARNVFEELLLGKGALYPEYLDRTEICRNLTDHMGGKWNYAKRLCLVLTFELWLQQVYKGAYRYQGE
jgi:asparagine synthase (glutamine-hydrolysing)